MCTLKLQEAELIYVTDKTEAFDLSRIRVHYTTHIPHTHPSLPVLATLALQLVMIKGHTKKKLKLFNKSGCLENRDPQSWLLNLKTKIAYFCLFCRGGVLLSQVLPENPPSLGKVPFSEGGGVVIFDVYNNWKSLNLKVIKSSVCIPSSFGQFF